MKQYRCIAGFTKPGRRYYLGDVIREDEYMSLYLHERRWFRLVEATIDDDKDWPIVAGLMIPDEPKQDDGFSSPPQEDEQHKFSGFDHGSFGGAGAGSDYDNPSSNDSNDSSFDSSNNDSSSSNSD